jgi:hypothetical protein
MNFFICVSGETCDRVMSTSAFDQESFAIANLSKAWAISIRPPIRQQRDKGGPEHTYGATSQCPRVERPAFP